MPANNPYGYLPTPRAGSASISGTFGPDPITGAFGYQPLARVPSGESIWSRWRHPLPGSSNVNRETQRRAAQNRMQQQRLSELRRLSPRRYADALQALVLKDRPGSNVGTPPSRSVQPPRRESLASLFAGKAFGGSRLPGRLPSFSQLAPPGGTPSQPAPSQPKPPSGAPPQSLPPLGGPIKRGAHVPRYDWRGGR